MYFHVIWNDQNINLYSQGRRRRHELSWIIEVCRNDRGFKITVCLELATLLLGHSDFVGEYLAGRDGALVGGKVSLITVPFSNLAFRQ